jgi:hypothetical protein
MSGNFLPTILGKEIIIDFALSILFATSCLKKREFQQTMFLTDGRYLGTFSAVIACLDI